MTEIQAQEQPAHVGLDAAEISNAIVQLMHRCTGRGPTKSRTVVKGDVAVLILQKVLSSPEVELQRSGQGDAVLEMRKAYWEAMRQEACRIVEENLRRPVITGMMGCDLEQDLMVLTFLLEDDR